MDRGGSQSVPNRDERLERETRRLVQSRRGTNTGQWQDPFDAETPPAGATQPGTLALNQAPDPVRAPAARLPLG